MTFDKPKTEKKTNNFCIYPRLITLTDAATIFFLQKYIFLVCH